MSYRVENEEMRFLNKVSQALENLEKEIKYLEVDIYDIPTPDSRYPYNEETEVDDYIFYFTYKGENFSVQPSAFKGFKLEIIKKDVIKTLTFTMKEKTPTLKKIWKETLKELEETLNLKEEAGYFFYQWCREQDISAFGNPEKDKTCQRMYELITKEMDPKKIETMLEERYKVSSSRIDLKFKNDVTKEIDIQFHAFLDGLRYFVIVKKDVFCFRTKEEAFEFVEKETMNIVKKSLKESIEKYNEIQERVNKNV